MTTAQSSGQETWEFRKNGVPIDGSSYIPREENTKTMTAMTMPATLTVAAPSPATRSGFRAILDGSKAKIAGVTATGRSYVARGIRALRLDKAYLSARRYLGWAAGRSTAVARGAGLFPLALLTISSETGQKALGGLARVGARATAWALGKADAVVDWIARKFGKPGNRFADWRNRNTARLNAWVSTNAKKIWTKVAPLLNPENIVMKSIKVISFVMVAFNLTAAFVPGPWSIPVFVAACGLGLALNKDFRNIVNSSWKRVSVEHRTRQDAIASVRADAEKIVNEHGPEISQMSSAAKGEYKVRLAMIKALDGQESPYEGLTSHQRQRAEKAVREMEEAIAAHSMAAAEADMQDPAVQVQADLDKATATGTIATID